MGAFSGRPSDKVVNLAEVLKEEENPIYESVFGEIGKFVTNLGILSKLTKEMNVFVKSEAERVKRQKGKISEDEYIEELMGITKKVKDKVMKSGLPDYMQDAFIAGMDRQFEKEFVKAKSK